MAKNGSNTKYQPVASGGVLSVFQRLFVATPSYHGTGQAQPRSGGLFGGVFGGTPVYQTASAEKPLPAYEPACCEQLPEQGESSDSSTETGCEPVQSAPLTIVITRD